MLNSLQRFIIVDYTDKDEELPINLSDQSPATWPLWAVVMDNVVV